jgi:hypothetical protein
MYVCLGFSEELLISFSFSRKRARPSSTPLVPVALYPGLFYSTVNLPPKL